MFVTYTPEDGDKQEWEFLPGRVRASEQAMVEKRAGSSWMKWLMDIKAGPGPARRVLVWHLLRREHPATRWEDVDPIDDEVLVEMNTAELIEARGDFLKAGGLDSDEGSHVLGMFDREIEEARAKFGEPPAGKAPSRSGPPPTSGP